jgi:hypothetical protein
VGGGSRIPRISERKARSVAELRAAGVGVRRVLMVHDNTPRASDVFDAVLTALDPDVAFDLLHLANAQPSGAGANGHNNRLSQDVERARRIGREVTVHNVSEDPGPQIVRLTLEMDYDLVVLDSLMSSEGELILTPWQQYIGSHASCPVCLFSLPGVPREVVDATPSTAMGPADRKSGRH